MRCGTSLTQRAAGAAPSQQQSSTHIRSGGPGHRPIPTSVPRGACHSHGGDADGHGRVTRRMDTSPAMRALPAALCRGTPWARWVWGSRANGCWRVAWEAGRRAIGGGGGGRGAGGGGGGGGGCGAGGGGGRGAGAAGGNPPLPFFFRRRRRLHRWKGGGVCHEAAVVTGRPVS